MRLGLALRLSRLGLRLRLLVGMASHSARFCDTWVELAGQSCGSSPGIVPAVRACARPCTSIVAKWDQVHAKPGGIAISCIGTALVAGCQQQCLVF